MIKNKSLSLAEFGESILSLAQLNDYMEIVKVVTHENDNSSVVEINCKCNDNSIRIFTIPIS